MRLLIAAVLVYIAISLYMGLSLPGLQYDEAIYEHGAVALLTGDQHPGFSSEDHTWVRAGRMRIPLMVTSYAGAAKHYLLVGPFAIFGTAPAAGRVVSMLLGAIGIFGIGRALQVHAGHHAGAATACVLAVHPAYIGWTIYDNAGTALWMASTGLIALALSRLANRADRMSSLLLGLAIGFALWGRVNFLWMLAGLAVAVLVAFRGAFARLRWPAFFAGSVIGAAPLIAFELLSRFATRQFPSQALSLPLVWTRFQFAVNALGYDGERAGMWGGTAAPAWQASLFALVIPASIAFLWLVPLTDRMTDVATRIGRAAGIASIVACGLALLAPLAVNPHHFAALLPLPAVAVTMAGVRLGRMSRAPVAILAAAYLVFALSWNRIAHEGLAATRGVGMWSSAIAEVSGTLLRTANGREVRIVDWGLGNNLYVLTRAGIPLREVFWHPEPWRDLVGSGGLFLMNAPDNTHFPEAARQFQHALEQTGAAYTVTTFRQADGAEYARLYDVRRLPARGGS